ncbi:MAG: Nucleotidyltransferase domain protein [Candidatus Methanofastidiosum methylothiophilum]|uniref:Nucleotidyltransferase domain protein n=1 Tax=Candidatus Methanofastidiosum methylothiophilum TaxID=1705564 RepID=A0A150IMD1_9EURY|nr:MAG: Nucleotidyltransferase domain protein [Candidatus Methanofastidiosum methylthiophilus]KYC48260.1 MAG: Nucleotidyltransferase domain protein [Candidatus Methanofastidiosum methylthiophilus]KYC50917.1 MAG: Nucleotidyltransferase domain protein [Candidatus Methanofastidiosum methylthiophilus]
MLQNCNDYEIILALLKGKSHIREIARKLKTNQTTIKRRLDVLYNQNIVDYKVEGKNYVYFIKKSLEARSFVIISESYNFILFLKKYPYLKGIIKKIMEKENINMAIVFGSYAKGISTESSDIDIYIETEDLNLKKEIELIDSRLSVKIGRYEKENLLIKEIETNHIIVKGIERFYETNRFFG